MGETGKKPKSRKDHGEDSKSQKKKTCNNEESRGDEMIMYRILCPDNLIGSVIGKSGKVINSIRQETRAKVKVMDPFLGSKERVIFVYCYVENKEDVEVDDEYENTQPLCPAQDALLKVDSAIGNASTSGGDSDKKRKEKEEAQLLVPSSQAANIIGKSGATINKMRSKTRANIKLSSKDNSDPNHTCALSFDNFLQSVDDMKSMAVEVVLLLQEKINDNDDRDTINFRLLVPSKVIGCVIGMSGAIINEIRKRTKVDVRISKGKKPKCARDDELVEIVVPHGEAVTIYSFIAWRERYEAELALERANLSFYNSWPVQFKK